MAAACLLLYPRFQGLCEKCYKISMELYYIRKKCHKKNAKARKFRKKFSKSENAAYSKRRADIFFLTCKKTELKREDAKES
jgi:hypothetical protein